MFKQKMSKCGKVPNVHHKYHIVPNFDVLFDIKTIKRNRASEHHSLYFQKKTCK